MIDVSPELKKEVRKEEIKADNRKVFYAVVSLGIAFTGLGFTWDYFAGNLVDTTVYSPILTSRLLPIWLSLPIIGGLSVFYGTLKSKNMFEAFGLTFNLCWYFIQLSLFLGAASSGRGPLVGPMLLYPAVLIPANVVNLVTVLQVRKVEKGKM